MVSMQIIGGLKPNADPKGTRSSRGARSLRESDESAPLPSIPQKPGLGCLSDRLLVGWRESGRPFPVGEPHGRRAGIDVRPARQVLLCVHQHVHDRVSHFARRRERASMKSIVPDRAPSPEHAIDGMGKPACQPHEPARKRALVVRLDEQVEVVGLHGEVHHAKPRAPHFSERTPNFEENRLLP